MAGVADTLRRLRLSDEQISSRTQVSLSRVKEILNGSPVMASELRALARGLKLPMRAFSPNGKTALTEDLAPRFRSAAASMEEREPTLERISRHVEAALKLLPPRESLPLWLRDFFLQGEESYPEAERLASQLRALIYPGQLDDPATDLPQRLASLDGLLLSELRNSKYEGASLVANAYLFIFVSPRFPARMLFTLGHELGHVVAHHSVEAAHLDLPGNIGGFRNRSEGFADAFSSAFLLPRAAVGRALKEIRSSIGASGNQLGDVEILLLAIFYGVSFDVAARRCESLGLLPPGGAASLSAYLRKEHQNPERRAAALNLPPREAVHFEPISPILMKYVHDRVSENSTSLSWVADQLGISIGDIYKSHASTSLDRATTH